ncbi:MAG: addiction module antidote protein [Reyranella sp.]
MATVTKTIPFDAAEFFTDPADQAELLNEAFASGNAAFVANVLGTIARARGMSKVAQEVGVTREGLYKALSDKGDPKLTTFLGVLSALQLELAARPGKSRKPPLAKAKTRPRRKAA